MPAPKNAPANGSYLLDGNYYVAVKGAPMPEGAVFTPYEAAEEGSEAEYEEKAKADVVETKAKGGAPENKSA